MTATATPTSEYAAAPNSGKGRSEGASENAVKAIEARNNGAQPQMTRMLGPLIRGTGASAVGTLATDVSLYLRYRHDGGNAPFRGWESSDGLVSSEGAPAPALVAMKLLERVLQDEVSPRYARLLSNVTPWGYGVAGGAGYGLLLGSRRKPAVWFGLPFGAAVSAGGYVVLSPLGVSRSGSTTSRRS